MTIEQIGRKQIKIPKYITSGKNIQTGINRGTKWLMMLKKKYGIYENFGEGVSSKIRDKYINSSSYTDEMNKRRNLLQNFDEWRYRYN